MVLKKNSGVFTAIVWLFPILFNAKSFKKAVISLGKNYSFLKFVHTTYGICDEKVKKKLCRYWLRFFF